MQARQTITKHEQFRRLGGYTVTSLAAAVGVSHTYVSRIEGQHVPASARYRKAVARLLGVHEAVPVHPRRPSVVRRWCLRNEPGVVTLVLAERLELGRHPHSERKVNMNDTPPTHAVSWRWDDDGPTVTGEYVKMDEAVTDYGRKPILILGVDGEPRSVWLFDAALVSQFREELAKRASGDFDAGERVPIERGAEKVKSSNGRGYWPYKVRFPDAPRRSASSILGVVDDGDTEIPTDPLKAASATDDDSIPF